MPLSKGKSEECEAAGSIQNKNESSEVIHH